MVEIDPANSLGGCNGGDSVNWEEVKNMLLAAKDDYGQLFEKGRPISNDVNLLLKKLSRTVPSNADFRNPQAMSQWAQAAALNAPMMGVVGKLPPTKFSQAHDLAQKNAALPIEQGGLGLPPNNTAMDRARAMGFENGYYKGMYPYDWTKETKNYPGPEITEISRPTEFPAFNNGEAGVKIAGFVTKDKDVANRFADSGPTSKGAVYPLMINEGKSKLLDAKGGYAGDIQFGESGKYFRDLIRAGGIDSLKIKNTIDEGDILTMLNPKNIRSRFAAFDPLQKDSANILASILLGTSLAGGIYNDE